MQSILDQVEEECLAEMNAGQNFFNKYKHRCNFTTVN